MHAGAPQSHAYLLGSFPELYAIRPSPLLPVESARYVPFPLPIQPASRDAGGLGAVGTTLAEFPTTTCRIGETIK
jgi:hypothetical protein